MRFQSAFARFSASWQRARVRDLAVPLVLLACSGDVLAQRMPQDNFGRGNVVCCTGELIYGHDFDRAGNLFIATNRSGGRLLKLDRRFVEVAAVPITLLVEPSYYDVRTDSAGNVYFSAGQSGVISRFSSGLASLGAVSMPSFLRFDVLDNGAGFAIGRGQSLSIHDAAGTFVRSIGASCSPDPMSICQVSDLAVLPSGQIAVLDGDVPGTRISIFGVDGSFIASQPSAGVTGIALMPGNNVLQVEGNFLRLRPLPGSGVQSALTSLNLAILNLPLPTVKRLRASLSGDIVLVGPFPEVFPPVHFVPGFTALAPVFGASPLPERTSLPQPRVISTARQPASTNLDVTFLVDDEDNASVDARVLAFRDGPVVGFASAVRMTALVNGTAANLGPGTPTGVQRTVTWNAAVDLGTSQGAVDLSVHVLARDGRGLVDLDFIAIPAGTPSGAGTDLIISRRPVSESQMLDAWLWLVASNDPRITFANGEVRANVGPLNGQLLTTGAFGEATTAQGRRFLFETILNVREATPAERTRAREASTPGIVNRFPPRNGMSYLENISFAVNQFGIETTQGTESGYYVVVP